jgi:hypothetical protein
MAIVDNIAGSLTLQSHSLTVSWDDMVQTSGLGFDEMKRLPEANPGGNLFNTTLVEAKHILFFYPVLFLRFPCHYSSLIA